MRAQGGHRVDGGSWESQPGERWLREPPETAPGPQWCLCRVKAGLASALLSLIQDCGYRRELVGRVNFRKCARTLHEALVGVTELTAPRKCKWG